MSAWQLLLLMISSEDHGKEVLVTEVGRILLFSIIEVATEIFEEEVDFCETRDLQDGVDKLTVTVLVEVLADSLILEDFDLICFLFSAFKELFSDLLCLIISVRLSFFCTSL